MLKKIIDFFNCFSNKEYIYFTLSLLSYKIMNIKQKFYMLFYTEIKIHTVIRINFFIVIINQKVITKYQEMREFNKNLNFLNSLIHIKFLYT